MFDPMLASLEIATKTSNVLNDLDLSPKAFNLLTIHRAENTDDKERFKSLLDFVASSSDSKKTLFPAHPRSKKFIEENAIKLPESIIISKPFGYLDTLVLLKNSHILFTDSGGMQKEAYWLKVPCITLRDETEWVETIESGWNVLYKDYIGTHTPTDHTPNAYGDGHTAERIVNVIVRSKARGVRWKG
jgi:UDP-GlcNAc3NAcA epimerase